MSSEALSSGKVLLQYVILPVFCKSLFNSITNSVLLATGGSMSNMAELEAEHAISGDQELEQHERAEKFLSVVERLELQMNKQMYDHHEMKIIRNG
jgi:hypothetical protein